MSDGEPEKPPAIVAPTESTARIKPSPDDEEAAARLVFRDHERKRDVILLVTRADIEQIHIDSLSLLSESK